MGNCKPISNCTAKKRYESEKQAREAQTYLWQNKLVNMDVYKCWLCEGWHLTRGDSDE